MNREKNQLKPDEYGYGHGEEPEAAEKKNVKTAAEKKDSKRFSGKVSERRLDRGHSKRS